MKVDEILRVTYLKYRDGLFCFAFFQVPYMDYLIPTSSAAKGGGGGGGGGGGILSLTQQGERNSF